MLTFTYLLIPVALVVSSSAAQDEYTRYMAECEQAKRAGDFARMEESLQNALRYGRGNEYTWRSLAWAQARQGKWKESLENAQKNIKRNGITGWSLHQLADSALGVGDFALASKSLNRASQLRPELLQGSEGALMECSFKLLSATALRRYDIHFKVDLQQGGPDKTPVWLLIPQKETSLQSFTFTVRNAVSSKEMHVGIRDYIEVVQKPGEPFFVDGKLVLKPFCLGHKRLQQVPASGCPEKLKQYLTKFQNYSWWDPDRPEVQSIASKLKGKSSAETVQNVLDWFKKEIHYDASIKDDPALGQLGTILKLRYGGCHHNSGLFVTLCRAAGVPACVAHGNSLPLDDKPFRIFPPIGHGWAEVYINSIGWIPVEPTDVDSLRLFTLNHAYVSVGASNRPPDRHHFSSTIGYNGKDFQLVSIQGCLEISGKLIRTELPKRVAASKEKR
jgi:hypothetical protein